MKKIYALLFLLAATISISFGQGTESFNNIPNTPTPGTYLARTWTGDNSLTWNATDARTDLTLNGKAIVVRNGSVTCASMPNGIGSLSFKHQQSFTGSNPVLEVYINNVL